MLRITASKSGAKATAYFDAELSRGDYYAERGHVPGQWHGKAAELLGLSGEVTREQFARLAGNHHPETGEQLTPRMKENRRAGYDFTFSAPKSVSAFYEYLQATGRTEQAGQVLHAFRDAVRATMDELEADMRVRVRAKGADGDRVTGNLVWAEFVHFQARPVEGVADPHLHTHAYAMNLTHDGKQWKAGEFGSIKRDATYYEAAFDARLGFALQGMGFAVERAGLSFELAGVARSTVEKFSRRTAEVERDAAERGIVSDKLKEKVGARTRANKDEGLSPEATRAVFMGRLSVAEEATFARIAVGGGGAPPPREAGPMATPALVDGRLPSGMRNEAEEAMGYAIRHSFERLSVISEKRLRAEALKYGVGAVLPEPVREAAEAAKARGQVLTAERDGQQVVTTREVLDEESAMLTFAREGRAEHAPFLGRAEGYGFKREWLSDEQRAAVRHVLASTDRVIGIRGGAGTGKTAMMQEAVEAIREASGKQVVMLAPSTQASRGVLREEGFADADTVARFLVDTAMQARAKDGVIVVDEAGLLGSRTMHALFEVAREQNARVVLQGDVRQHASVERGDALRVLERHGGVKFAELSTIRRQQPRAYREAVASIAAGDVADGLERLDRMGAVIEVEDGERHRKLAAWYLDAVGGGESAIVVSPTHAEGAKVTKLVREGLRAGGKLGESREVAQLAAKNWTEAERGDARNYAPGLVVSFHQNASGFRRGERGTVVGVEDGKIMVEVQGSGATRRKAGTPPTASHEALRDSPARGELKILPLEAAARFQVFERREMEIAVGDLVRLTANGKDAKGGRLNNGTVYRVAGFEKDGLKLAAERGATRIVGTDFGHLTHGYVTTSHAAQGRTVDRVFVAQGAESFRASSREQFYVSASRGRRSVHIFTDDKVALKDAVARSGQRLAAVEVVRPEPDRPSLFARVKERALEIARLARFHALKARAAEAIHRAEQREPEMAR